MGRPTKGEPGYEEANACWHRTMEERYGGKEGVHKMMQEMGRKGGRLGHSGGFAADHDRAEIAGRKGGSRSRRGLRMIEQLPDGRVRYQIKATGEEIILRHEDKFRMNEYLEKKEEQ